MVYNKFFTLGGIVFSFRSSYQKVRIMTSYLLLRNNKESGPFTLDELVAKGLKAYDLIWVKGKSAAWRYPGEIPELIQFAPPVEEQPYDRFYKKSAETIEQKPPVPAAVPVNNSTPVESAPPVEPTAPRVQAPTSPEINFTAPITESRKKASKEIVPEITPVKETETTSSPYLPAESGTSATSFVPKKSVFVTMPSGQRPPDPAPVNAQASEPVYQKYQPAAEQVLHEEKPTISIKENPAAAEIKYSQPLDEIKEMYVKTLQERKQRMANKAFLVQILKKVAIVIGIVGAGILIGLSINSGGAKKLVANESRDQALWAQHNLPVASEVNDAVDPVDQKQSEGTLLSAQTDNSYQSVENGPRYQDRIVTKKNNPGKEITSGNDDEALTRKEITAPEQLFDAEAEVPSAEVDQQTGERNRKVRDETELPVTQPDEIKTETRKPVRETTRPLTNNKSLASQVSVKTNNYKIVAFGGIRDLHVTVNNDSKYVLDKVLVELQYLKPNMEPFRVDVITFRSVSPNGSLTIRMPDTNRGIKVRYKIMNILSTQSAKDMADL